MHALIFFFQSINFQNTNFFYLLLYFVINLMYECLHCFIVLLAFCCCFIYKWRVDVIVNMYKVRNLIFINFNNFSCYIHDCTSWFLKALKLNTLLMIIIIQHFYIQGLNSTVDSLLFVTYQFSLIEKKKHDFKCSTIHKFFRGFRCRDC